MRMATNNDVLDSEHIHCVFDRRGFAAVDGSIGRDDVAGVSQYEELTRFRLSEQIGVYAGIRASDEQSQWMLTVHQMFKQPLLGTENAILKLVNTFNEFLHEYDFHGLTSARGFLRAHDRCCVAGQSGTDEWTQQPGVFHSMAEQGDAATHPSDRSFNAATLDAEFRPRE